MPGGEWMNPPDVIKKESTGVTAAIFGESDSSLSGHWACNGHACM